MESEVLADQKFLLEAFSPYLKKHIGTPELCKALSFRFCAFKVFTEGNILVYWTQLYKSI